MNNRWNLDGLDIRSLESSWTHTHHISWCRICEVDQYQTARTWRQNRRTNLPKRRSKMRFAKYCLLFCMIAVAVLSNVAASPVETESYNVQLKSSTHNLLQEIIDKLKEAACKAAKGFKRQACKDACLDIYRFDSSGLERCNGWCDRDFSPEDC